MSSSSQSKTAYWSQRRLPRNHQTPSSRRDKDHVLPSETWWLGSRMGTV